MDRAAVQYAHSLIGRVPFLDGLAVFFASYAPYLFVAAFVSVLYVKGAFGDVTGLVRKQRRLQFVLATILALLLASGIAAPAIHYAYGRARPFATFGWTPLFAHDANPSFPSNHATFMFTVAASMWQLRRRWGYWFFAAAFLTGAARVYALVHYPTDILFGAVVGIAAVFAVRRAVPAE